MAGDLVRACTSLTRSCMRFLLHKSDTPQPPPPHQYLSGTYRNIDYRQDPSVQTSLAALERVVFLLLKPLRSPSDVSLSLPLLSDSFFAPGTPKPLKDLLRGKYRLLPKPYRKLEGGYHRRCQEPIKASFFLPDLRT